MRTPGLVTLPDGARVADALTAAGGALPGTDLALLNLASRLSDGDQILVGVTAPPGTPVSGSGGATISGSSSASGARGTASARVSVNTATAAQLETLPGVGPVLAQRIIAYRESHGRFTSVEQLRDVPGVGERRLADLRAAVTL